MWPGRADMTTTAAEEQGVDVHGDEQTARGMFLRARSSHLHLRE